MDTLSFILLVACGMAMVFALFKHVSNTIQHNIHQAQHRATTTLARLDFEDAERSLAKAKLVLNIVQSSQQVREPVLQKAIEHVEIAAEEWVRSLKSVFQMRKRARSPSPESIAIYDRFTRRTHV